jgi:hypothetical protein
MSVQGCFSGMSQNERKRKNDGVYSLNSISKTRRTYLYFSFGS